MRTPEEIKKGLECCTPKWMGTYWRSCSSECPYIDLAASCRGQLAYDALAYIQQLEVREWDLFNLISSAWFGKQCYFRQDDGNVYSRLSGEYMSFDQAVDELAHELTSVRECTQDEDRFRNLPKMAPKWISAKKPPKEEGEYIVIVRRADDREERMWDIFRPGRGWCEDNEGECVIAWMSFDALPDLPEGWEP